MQTPRQKFMKTPKGTELPFIQTKGGKDYLQVMHRLVWFREEHPDWAIQTQVVVLEQDHAVVRASILNASGYIVAQATKMEHKAHFQDYLEKAETGAIGRALALCGYGTQFAPELDEEDRIVDSPAVARPTRASGATSPGSLTPDSPKAGPGPTAPKHASPSRAPIPPPGGKVQTIVTKPEPSQNFDDFPSGMFNS